MRSRLAISLILIPCTALALSLCAPCQTPTATETVHVAIRVFDLNNEPVGTLNTVNFTLSSANGVPVPAVLEPSETHLLLILSAGQGDLTPTGVSALAHQLAPLWKSGWRISIHDAQGRETAYLADESALRTTVASSALTSASVPDAIGTLAEFPGHRVVFVQTGPHFDVETATIRQAQRLHAMLYRIGAPRSNRFEPEIYVPDTAYVSAVVQGIPAAGHLVSPGGYFPATAPTPYLHEETTFRAALRDAQLDASAFYDLLAVVPSDTPALTLAVHATSNVPTSYRITAQPWADEHEPLPNIAIRTP